MITSLQNSLVKHIVALQQRKARDEAGEFVVEGWRFAGEALARGAKINQVVYCPEQVRPEGGALLERCRQGGIPVEEVERRVLRKMTATEEAQGILAVVRKPKFSWAHVPISARSLLLVVDGVQDPGNLGTILRTALAAGVSAVCLTQGTVDLFNPKVLRSTMGAIFSLIVLQKLEPRRILAFCQEHRWPIVVGDITGESLYGSPRLSLPLVLVVGNEGAGPSSIFRTSAQRLLTIPMGSSVESLNVASAAGIMLFEIVRQRDFL
ncbi:MAG: TrmH family RNA methyltransferase [Desulfitobacteriaceae bacterium]